MNEFDQFVKHKLKVKYYIRYADDFVVLSNDREYLENLIVIMGNFLKQRLNLSLHPDKVFVKTIASGVDFLGWVNFFDHRVLRTGMRRRMVRKIKKGVPEEAINSYCGLLTHGNTHRLRNRVWTK